MEHTQTENKNDSEYDRLVNEIREKINSHAKDYVGKLYTALRKEGLTTDDAREKIEKDFVNVWSKRTILAALPEDAKNEERIKSGKKGAEKKKSLLQSSAARNPEKERLTVAASVGGESIPTTSDVDITTINRSFLPGENYPQQPAPSAIPVVPHGITPPAQTLIKMETTNRVWMTRIIAARGTETPVYFQTDGTNVTDVIPANMLKKR